MRPLCRKACEAALMRISAAAFAEAGKQYLGRTYREMDCQAFVEAAMERAGIRMNLAGSNAWYRKMTWTGTPEECKARFGAVPVGALLYILERDGKEPAKYKPDGVGNASHMGVKTGTGKGAIHSSASRGGVCESEFHDKTVPNGGWNRVGLWDAFDYGEAVNALLAADDEPDDADPPDGGDARMATVYAANGKPVKLRSRPLADDKKTTWDWVPVGATVTLRIRRQILCLKYLQRLLSASTLKPQKLNGRNAGIMTVATGNSDGNEAIVNFLFTA